MGRGKHLDFAVARFDQAAQVLDVSNAISHHPAVEQHVARIGQPVAQVKAGEPIGPGALQSSPERATAMQTAGWPIASHRSTASCVVTRQERLPA